MRRAGRPMTAREITDTVLEGRTPQPAIEDWLPLLFFFIRDSFSFCYCAARLKKHSLKETEAGITMKLKRGMFAATFFLACLAALELEGVVLEGI